MQPYHPVPVTLDHETGRSEVHDKKSKERREKDRKVLRSRRINSLKRQISMKEKMLEVDINCLISNM